jgi:hypothetical protein
LRDYTVHECSICVECGKALYITRKTAEAVRKQQMRNKKADPEFRKRIAVYECPSGQGWHIGKKWVR